MLVLMNKECHESICNRLSFAGCGCECGFIQRLLSGEVKVTDADRGNSGKEIYIATRYDGPDACIPMGNRLQAFLDGLKIKCQNLKFNSESL